MTPIFVPVVPEPVAPVNVTVVADSDNTSLAGLAADVNEALVDAVEEVIEGWSGHTGIFAGASRRPAIMRLDRAAAVIALND